MKQKTRTVGRSLSVGALATVGLLAVVAPASAHDQSTVSGYHPPNPATCNLSWEAEAVYSTQADAYNALDPGLLKDRDGNPISGGPIGGNGGIIKETTTDLSPAAPGMLEVHRFVTERDGVKFMNVRIPVASSHPFSGANLQVTLDQVPGAQWQATTDQATVPLARWGESYTHFTWSKPTGATLATQPPAAGGTFTVPIPALAAGTGTVVQYSTPITDEELAKLHRYSATLNARDDSCTPEKPVAKTTTTMVDQPYTVVEQHPVTVATPRSYTLQVDTYSTRRKVGWWYQGRKLKASSPALNLSPADRLSLARVDDDNRLYPHEDQVAWGGASTVQFLTVTSREVASTRGGIYALVAQRTGHTVTPDEKVLGPGQSFTKAWVLAPGATPAKPHGVNGNLPQTDVDATTFSDTLTTVNKPVTVVKHRQVPVTTTTWTCPSTGAVVASGTSPCPATKP